MSTVTQFREGLSKAWDTLTIGWRELRELAGDALTRFNPRTTRGEVESAEDRIVSRASRWGLLAAEVTETDDTVDVLLEAPGLEPDDFEIDVRGDLLIVRGEKRVSREETRGHYHIMERAYGQFERAIRLPASVDDEGATARYRRGVLTVSLPKNAKRSGRRIAVET
ncbi:MAG TPA: Hsp20/alpha crystallin family protein [Woeseiaceae bacterium]|nr:Hsp20/alpha crystallin family protein [Woeseiaceae bacterium]